MKRIEHLRNKALEGTHLSQEFFYHFYKEYTKNAHLPEESRYGEAFYYAFSNLTPSISDGELIVGKRDIPLQGEALTLWENTYQEIARERNQSAGGGQASHMAIDYELLLTEGIRGVMVRIDRYLKNCTPEQALFYNCCKRCLEGVIKHAENYAALALRQSAETSDPARKAELLKIAEICKKVPANPAESFYEGVQAVHFITHCISLDPLRMNPQQFQLGHPDRYLLPLYEKDIQNGTITREYAQLLLDCLGIQINTRVPHGLSSGYMVGGRDENGNVVANELTELCMQVVDDIRLVYPSVGLCWTKGMPEKYLDIACALLQKGHSHPAIFNDDVISKGLRYYGVSEKRAHNYIHSTCVEITPVAASNVWVASPYTNMPQLLLDIMDREYDSLEHLLETYFQKLDRHIQNNFEDQNQKRQVRAQNSINPLLSCFVDNCLERGVDIEKGGAEYNWIMPSFVGVANLVDALYAINELVFKQKTLTLCGFKDILDRDFAGEEALRLQILNRIHKYGNDIDDVDRYFRLITEHISAECEKYSGIHRNARLIPSVFCWVMHERFGRDTSATPDGRMAGYPLGDGSGPCQGRELNGPTASILSSTKWDHHKFIGGVAVNLKFSRSALGVNSTKSMKALIDSYLQRGGFELQINVVDNETLKRAQAHPEEYRDLVVRIGGYSDYFVKLSPEMQAELILRTTHNT